MSLTPKHRTWAIVLTFVIGLMLMMFPLPEWLIHYRPEWMTLILLYWCLALPHRVGIGSAWLIGLLLDVVRGAVLGQNAMALTVVALIATTFHQRIRLYPLWQQSIVVLVLVALQQMLVLWVKGIIGQAPGTWLYWAPSLTSMLIWPWVFLLLRDLRRHFKVS